MRRHLFGNFRALPQRDGSARETATVPEIPTVPAVAAVPDRLRLRTARPRSQHARLPDRCANGGSGTRSVEPYAGHEAERAAGPDAGTPALAVSCAITRLSTTVVSTKSVRERHGCCLTASRRRARWLHIRGRMEKRGRLRLWVQRGVVQGDDSLVSNRRPEHIPTQVLQRSGRWEPALRTAATNSSSAIRVSPPLAIMTCTCVVIQVLSERVQHGRESEQRRTAKWCGAQVSHASHHWPWVQL